MIPILHIIGDHRTIDQSSTQMCTKIDTSIYEYAGISPAPKNDVGYALNEQNTNPNIYVSIPSV